MFFFCYNGGGVQLPSLSELLGVSSEAQITKSGVYRRLDLNIGWIFLDSSREVPDGELTITSFYS